MRQSYMSDMVFRAADANSNGRITAAEWEAFFKQAAKGKDSITPEDLRAAMFPPSMTNRSPESARPPRAMLLMGLFAGEIGSIAEGPRVGQTAPDFRLKTHDREKEVMLSQYRGDKPVVLIFGSFT
jgi:hypothetical protein